MTMQRGFNAGAEVAPTPNGGDPLIGSSIFHCSNKEGKNRHTVVLLDDEPVWGYRHKIKRPYIEGQQNGDWKERDIRLTCQVPHSKEDSPRTCQACEAAIRHGETIKRHFTANLTGLDMGEHRTRKGQVYHDLKKMIELDWAAYETFKEQKKALGSLVGMVFSVMRPTGDAKASKTYGVWTPLQRINLAQQFWSSPAVRAIMENANKRGERITQQEAVQRLLTPIDYAKELNNYTPQNAERFIIRAVAKNYTASGGGAAGGFSPDPSGFQASGFQGSFGGPQPQFQGQGAPQFQGGPATMSPQAAPDYSVGPQAQAFQQQMQQAPAPGFQPMQPQGQPMPQQQQPFQPGPQPAAPGFGAPTQMPQGFAGSVPPPPNVPPQQYQPQQFAPQGPPQVGNPPGATMPQQMTMPPQQAAPQPSLAPWAGQQPGQPAPQPQFAPQPQMPQGQPMGQPQAAPPGGGYAFDAAPGWQQSFPGQATAPQPQAGPQGFQPMPQQAPQPQPGQFAPQPGPAPQPAMAGAPRSTLPF